MAVKRSITPYNVIFRLGWDLAKSQPLNDGMRPEARWDPSSKKLIFELGGTWRWVTAQAGVLWVATTPTPEYGALRAEGPTRAPGGRPFPCSTIEQMKLRREIA